MQVSTIPMFQFHYGSIKIYRVSNIVIIFALFQFHYGSIKIHTR